MKVCIYGLEVAPGIVDEPIKGGAELQMALLAKTLASMGISVVVVDPVAVKDIQVGSNLRLETVPDWNKGMRGLRLFRHRLPGLVRRLKSTGADVFYARGFSFYHLVPLAVAKLTGARFVTAIASDLELEGVRARYDQSYKKNISWWQLISTIIPNEIGVWLVRRFADVIFVQHTYQAQLSRRRFRTTIVQVNNIVGSDIYNVRPGASRSNVIIVGAFAKRKDLDILLPIVKRLPDVVFEFIGEVRDGVGEQVQNKLSRCANVIMHGALDRADTLAVIARGKALVNTSRVEGFPNTFLEAWALKTPVISLFVDPGGVIQKNNLGYYCHGDIELFSRLLQQERYDLDFECIREYVLTYHSGSHIKSIFDKLLEN